MNTNLNDIVASALHLPAHQVSEVLQMSDVETWDSLQHMSLIASLEEAYGVEFTFDEIVAMQSVAQIKAVLQAKGTQI